MENTTGELLVVGLTSDNIVFVGSADYYNENFSYKVCKQLDTNLVTSVDDVLEELIQKQIVTEQVLNWLFVSKTVMHAN